MEACSLLLGRPWQYDTDYLHHGHTNHYSLLFKGKKIILHPMTPEQIVKDDIARTTKALKQCQQQPATYKEIKLHAPLLLATRADFDELHVDNMPCYALVCSHVLVSLDDAPSLDIVTEPTNYTRLSKKIIHRADDLTNLSPYNPVVREITTDFKPIYIPAKIVISSAVTITSYIKVRVTNTSEFKHSYYKLVSNKSSGSI
jgi:hypothetical protein